MTTGLAGVNYFFRPAGLIVAGQLGYVGEIAERRPFSIFIDELQDVADRLPPRKGEACSRCRGIRVHDPVETLFTIAWNKQLSVFRYAAGRGFMAAAPLPKTEPNAAVRSPDAITGPTTFRQCVQERLEPAVLGEL